MLYRLFAQVVFFHLVISEWVKIVKVNHEPSEKSTTFKPDDYWTDKITSMSSNDSSNDWQKDDLFELNNETETLTARKMDQEPDDLDMDDFMSLFINKFKNSLLTYAGQSIKEKIHYLENLKGNFDNEIAQLSNHRETPESRTYGAENRHLSVPSNEGTLMTIGFLTFASFLVKLVLKFIYTVKNKDPNHLSTLSPIMSSSYFDSIMPRQERQGNLDQIEESAKIMRDLGEFPDKFY